ncbi:MAG: BamA/TamA family outer membrane protein, partial [Bacteroidota bacterium]
RSSHQASGLFAFATRAVQLKYSGHFTKAIENWSFYQQLEFDFPNYLQNYFGLGNEFEIPDEPINFFRVRGSQLRVFSSVSPPWRPNHSLKIGPYYELTEIDQTAGRIVSTENSGLSPQIFDIQHYLGGRMEYLGEEVGNLIQPSRGYRIEASAMYLFDLRPNSRGSGSIEASATLYVPLLGYRKLILATQIGWGYSFGDFRFYQAQSLGLPNSLRGYRRNRFAGSAKVYQSTDLRFPVLKARNKLTLGLIGTFDTGRIWLEGENTRTWRFTYGGGIYIAPLNLAVLRLYYNRRPGGGTFSFGAKFPF